MYTAFFYTKNNKEFVEKVKFYCKKYCIELFEIRDLREMLLKGSILQKYALFVDTTSVDISSDLLDYMLKQNGNSKLLGVLLIGDESYNNTAIDEYYVHKVSIGDTFAKEFVSKADRLRKNIKEVTLQSTGEIANEVYEFLTSTKLLSKYSGFGYIKEAIIYCLAQGGGVDKLTNSIYPYVAANNKTTINNVERNIRIAIECSWNKNGGLVGFSKKPSNKEFLAYVLNSVIQKINKLA